eukprot:COSAG01_NODE_50_length_31487_cov_90.470243_37_plen_249_part_00
MTERTCGLVESVEDGDDETSRLPRLALRARSALVAAAATGLGAFPAATPFGPLDLCYVVKTWRPGVPGLFPGRAYRRGFVHSLSGLPDVSVEGVCAYFKSLCDAAEQEAAASRWLPTVLVMGEWTIEEAEFCFYAPFSRADVRLRVRVPGTLSESTVGGRAEAGGLPLPTTHLGPCGAALWREARLGSMLRALRLERCAPSWVRCHGWTPPPQLRAWAPPPTLTLELEAEFLSLGEPAVSILESVHID